MPGGASQPRKKLDAWQEWAKQRGARGLAYVLVQEDGELGGPVAKNLSEAERAGLAAYVGAQPGDCIFFAAGAVKSSRALLGAARLEIGRRGDLIDEDAWSFLWIVDAPLFEPTAMRRRPVTSRSGTAPGPPYTTPSPRRRTWTPSTPTRRCAGLGLRHRLQRQRDRWRLDPYPPRGHPEPGLRGDGARRGGGARRSSASCSTPSPTAPRRTAASPSAGTGSSRCSPAATRSARSSHSRSPVAASTP